MWREKKRYPKKKQKPLSFFAYYYHHHHYNLQSDVDLKWSKRKNLLSNLFMRIITVFVYLLFKYSILHTKLWKYCSFLFSIFCLWFSSTHIISIKIIREVKSRNSTKFRNGFYQFFLNCLSIDWNPSIFELKTWIFRKLRKWKSFHFYPLSLWMVLVIS